MVIFLAISLSWFFGFGVGTLAHENPFIELLILVFTSSNLIYVEP